VPEALYLVKVPIISRQLAGTLARELPGASRE
jgi:hypothetical protein